MKRITKLRIGAGLTIGLTLGGAAALAAADPFDGYNCVRVWSGGGWIGNCNLEGAPGTPTTMSRIAGADRFETSALLSRDAFQPGVPVVYIANGYNPADALGAGAATKGLGPVLLVPADGTLPASVATELARLNPARVIAAGGPSAVSDSMLSQAVTAALQ